MSIEVALHDELDKPFLERLPSGVGRVHAGVGHHVNMIVSVLEPLLLEGESDLLERLMADDSYPREFDRQQHFLLIRKAPTYL